MACSNEVGKLSQLFDETRGTQLTATERSLQTERHGYNAHNNMIFAILHYATVESRYLVCISLGE